MPNEKMKQFFDDQKTAFTFDDVLLDPNYADFFPNEVDLTGKLSRNIYLPLPIIAAAMSSVVNSKTAISLAKAGGIASVPRSFSPEEQAKIVGRVKHHINGFVDEPIPAYAHETVADLLARREEKTWEFDSFPVLDEQGKFVGLMTHNNFKRCDDSSMLVGAVMTKVSDLVVASEGISKKDAYEKLKIHDKNVLPVMRTDGMLAGLYIFSDLKRELKKEKVNHNIDVNGHLRVMAAIGVGDEALLRAELLIAKGVDVLHIDMAHGFQKSVIDTVRLLKSKHGTVVDIVAGNVVGEEATLALIDAGSDGIISGIGGGAICTTRPVTGNGKPQVTAVWECARAAEDAGVPVCSDGGIRFSGDGVIALAAGASSFMLGGVLAGSDETPGEKYLINGAYWKDYYGMGSLRAMKESPGSRQRYLQSESTLVPEGVEGRVRYKGPVATVLDLMAGGLVKGFHYSGARNLSELHAKARFWRVTQAGVREAHPHDIATISQPPNYSGVA